jgi:N-acetyl-alpha-D-muramate 1-phosphate uridylyltransferase
VHHHARQIVDHVAGRARPKVLISDESAGLLDSAGGVIKALPQLGDRPFFLINADTFWIDRGGSNLERLALAWDGARMDILLMLAELSSTTGHTGLGDFVSDEDGRLARAPKNPDGLVYAGAGIFDAKLFSGAPVEKRSLNTYFDSAIAAGRLYGVVMNGHWITVGTPDAIPLAEAAVARALAERR